MCLNWGLTTQNITRKCQKTKVLDDLWRITHHVTRYKAGKSPGSSVSPSECIDFIWTCVYIYIYTLNTVDTYSCINVHVFVQYVSICTMMTKCADLVFLGKKASESISCLVILAYKAEGGHNALSLMKWHDQQWLCPHVHPKNWCITSLGPTNNA